MRKLLSSEVKSTASRILKELLKPFILFKWYQDKKNGLPLVPGNFEIYYNIHHRYWVKFFKFPNLIDCKDFNDKINWLKLFDQDPIAVQCCDKVLVRDFVEKLIGKKYLPQIHQVAYEISELDFKNDTLPKSFVVKTNHDSGTVFLVRDKYTEDFASIKRSIGKSLKTKFGWKDGEWPYSFVRPQVFIEEFLNPNIESAPADYKFHCTNGRVNCMQYIYDRGLNAKEIIVTPDGSDTGICLNPSRARGIFVKPDQWGEMLAVAQKLSQDFKYVRVDLYLIKNRIVFGELTFFPQAGLFPGEGQAEIGGVIDFDRLSYKKCMFK